MQLDLAREQATAAEAVSRAATAQEKAVDALARLDGERAARLGLETQLKVQLNACRSSKEIPPVLQQPKPLPPG
jgi:hypothetical protein